MEALELLSCVFMLFLEINGIYLPVHSARILAPTTYIFFASALPVIAFGAQLNRDTGWSILHHILACRHILSVAPNGHPLTKRQYELGLIGLFWCRWNLEHSWNLGFYSYLWHNTLHCGWATSLGIGSCRTNCYNVHVLVWLCKRKGRSGTRTVSCLGWMVMEFHLSSFRFSEAMHGMYIHSLYSLYWLKLYRVCLWTSLLLILLAIFNACDIINKFTRIAGELFGMLINVLFIQQAAKVSLT